MGPALGLQIGGVDVSVVTGMMQAFDNGQSACNVELIVGKTGLLGPQNGCYFAGRVEAETIGGLSFTR